jgi:broad specificity phosphatase PhoE
LQKTRLLLLRHAETSAPHLFHGAESDVGLSERGERQALVLGEYFKSKGARVLYCSSMRRAIATAEPIGAACGLRPVIVPSLHERKIGSLSGLSRDEGWDVYAEAKSNWKTGSLEYTHAGAESYADIRRRVHPFFENLYRDHPGETVVVVAHGVVIRIALISLIDSFQPADFDEIGIDFAAINDLEWDGRRWKALALNQVVMASPTTPVA